MLIRRLSTIVAGASAIVVLSATASSAHYCYFTNPNPNADAGRAGSQGFMPFGEFAAMVTGLCPAGVEVLADAADVSMSTLINAHGLMAGPTGGNKAISHLDFAALDGAMGDAAAACS